MPGNTEHRCLLGSDACSSDTARCLAALPSPPPLGWDAVAHDISGQDLVLLRGSALRPLPGLISLAAGRIASSILFFLVT